MFEKSLLDLIRGLRYHKGTEKAYIQNCLKECRAEVRSQDMDVKATALLKLVYLEMVGHDMSWASFHVLEVMSSAKLHQKRVGYLAAVQSFRTDTEVLMLATNLLKKDLSSASPLVMQLPIATLPHVLTPSLAVSVLPDLLPRLTHSHRVIRKKAMVTLYRMALVYPEALRAAWPKMRERLLDPDEDPSVTAAMVNVVCELGWRRPRDFLPLAPRLFELLVDGGNNWMAIKLIKLFATLTPLEPRLVRKLLPPLTDLIRTTPAMSLLYECINGIIQGGILGSDDDDDAAGREEIASLCVTKLRGMILVEGDANLQYVALLAFNKIVKTHPLLVAEQADVILDCLDSLDITIRIKTLDLVQGMVNSDNLVSIVSRLMRQLKQAAGTAAAAAAKPAEVRPLEFRAESDEEAEAARQRAKEPQQLMLPDEYKTDVVGRILAMCSQQNYSHLADFDWYIDILTQLLRTVPAARIDEDGGGLPADAAAQSSGADMAERVGNELRNVAVKVQAMRASALRAAEGVLAHMCTEALGGGGGGTAAVTSMALKPVVWLLGEYAELLASADDALAVLLQLVPRIRPAEVLATSVQAAVKLFARVAGRPDVAWTAERQAGVALLVARMVHVLEPLAQHPSLEVQERAVEMVELLKLAGEAVAAAGTADGGDGHGDAPLLLTQAIPALFAGWELHSVAAGAQRSVPVPAGLDLDAPIHANLAALLAEAEAEPLFSGTDAGAVADADAQFEAYYRQKPAAVSISSAEPASVRLTRQQEDVSLSAAGAAMAGSYQQQPPPEEAYLDADILARRRAQRQERHRYDPFYIGGGGSSSDRTSTPIHDILQRTNGPELDIDAIPVMALDLGGGGGGTEKATRTLATAADPPRPQTRPRIVVAADETLAAPAAPTGTAGSSAVSTPGSHAYESECNDGGAAAAAGGGRKAPKKGRAKARQGLLQVDSSHLGMGMLSLEEDSNSNDSSRQAGALSEREQQERQERQRRADAEMAQALREVEKRRLEMQRANERVQVAQGVPAEGATVVGKKKKKAGGEAAAKKTKVAKAEGGGEAAAKKKAAKAEGGGEAAAKKRPKKRAARVVDLDEGAEADSAML